MILIGTDEGIYRWFEGCGWPIFHSLQDRSVLDLASPGAGVLVAVDQGGDVLESTDNGMSWRSLPAPSGSGRPTAVAVVGVPPAVVLAVKPLGIYSRAVGAPVPDDAEEPSGVAALLGRAWDLAGGVTTLVAPRRAQAEGPVWSTLSAPPAPRSAVAPEVRVLAAATGPAPLWYAAVSGSGLWRCGDLGRSWEQCPGLPAEVYAVRPVEERPGHVWAATADGCRFSADGGASWDDRSGGLEAVRHVRAIDVKPGEPDTLLAGCAPSPPESAAPRHGLNFSLFESTNGGKSWSHVRKSFPEVFEYDPITDIRYDPAAPDNVIVALGSGELWVTRNGGAYWGPLARQIQAARVLCAVR
jgi:photosystem II stability/assembly factor-like uncharacterized protein